MQKEVQVANIFKDYFSSVFVAEDLTNILVATQMFQGELEDRLYTIDITENIVMEKLNRINVIISQGPDNLHGKLLYEVKN